MSRNLILTTTVATLINVSQPEDTHAFLDFLADEAKDLAQAAAVADATASLIGELSPDSDAEKGLEYLNNQSTSLSSEMRDVQFLGRDTEDFISGPKLTNGRLDQNIRATTGFIRKGKNIVFRVAALGTDAIVAVNGVQTNIALNEVQKNQQTLILQNQQMMNRQAQKEVREAKEWTTFISRQRAIRGTKKKD